MIRNNKSNSADDDDDDDEGQQQQQDQKREALIDSDTGIPIEDNSHDDGNDSHDDDIDDTEDEDSFVEDDEEEEDWIAPEDGPTAEEMRERLILSCEDVFCDDLLTKPMITAVAVTDGDKDDESKEGKEEEEEAPAAVGEGMAALDDDVELFLKEFDLGSKTEEISKLLEEDDSVRTIFTELATDQALVTYTDFWTRYFYRIGGAGNINDQRLMGTYRIYYDQHLLEKKQRRYEQQQAAATSAAAAKKRGTAMGLASGVTSFLGGVVDRLTTESLNNDEREQHEFDDSMNHPSAAADNNTEEHQQQQPGPATRAALGFLSTVTNAATMGGGRPPFVMNTAVSDSDEHKENDDSEEELGWDDDDDDDDENVDINGGNNSNYRDDDDDGEGETTVEFKDAEKERLLEDLEQAHAERDALQKTVEMQAKELKKNTVSVPAQQHETAPSPASSTAATTGAQQLEIQLFEKDSELAALRARLEDDNHDGNKSNDVGNTYSNQQEEITKLNKLVSSKDQELDELRVRCDQTVTGKEELRSMLQKEIDALQQKLNDTVGQKEQSRHRVGVNQSEILEQAKKETKQIREQFESQILVLQNQVKEHENEQQHMKMQNDASILKLQSELESCLSTNKGLQSELDMNEQTIVQLKEELDQCKLSESNALEEAANAATSASERAGTTTAAATVLPPLSPGSNSTGVKVNTPDSSDDEICDDDGRAAAITVSLPSPSLPQPKSSTTLTPPHTTSTLNDVSGLGSDPNEKDDDDNDDSGGWGDDW